MPEPLNSRHPEGPPQDAMAHSNEADIVEHGEETVSETANGQGETELSEYGGFLKRIIDERVARITNGANVTPEVVAQIRAREIRRSRTSVGSIGQSLRREA